MKTAYQRSIARASLAAHQKHQQRRAARGSIIAKRKYQRSRSQRHRRQQTQNISGFRAQHQPHLYGALLVASIMKQWRHNGRGSISENMAAWRQWRRRKSGIARNAA